MPFQDKLALSNLESRQAGAQHAAPYKWTEARSFDL